ncbi:MAG: enoyl-CoA hydratase/isomerase family protein [Betaproteobacteria bacterium]|nr:enoyl-CoA hydratase/isomerase family protein [Betaproteobacteria bacterium]
MTSVPASDPALLTVEDGIATLALNRPASLNALDAALTRRLAVLGAQVEARADIRVLIVRGDGPSFCAGGDVQMFVDHGDGVAPLVRDLLREMQKFVVCLRRMDKIVLFSVHGTVAGGGMGLVSHADLCIAATGTRFVPAFNRLALPPDMGATFGFERAIGLKRSLQAFLYEDHVSAEVALEWGLINWIVPEERLAQATLRIAKKLAGNAPGAIAATKRLFQRSGTQDLPAQMNEEVEAMVLCMQDERFKSALADLARPKERGETANGDTAIS